MNVLNDFFEKVYCITCFPDVERQHRCVTQFEKFNIDFEFITAIDKILLKDIVGSDVSTSELSLTIGHLMCVQKAKLHKYNKIAILEDDFKLYDDWENRFKLFSSELPSVWSLLYLGQPEWSIGIYDTKRKPYSDHVSICKYGCSSHFMAIHESSYDECINLMTSLKNPVDVYYGDMQHNKESCYTLRDKSLADAISIPHKKYHDIIPGFDKTLYIASTLRESCKNP